ncbi:MAG TPA: hypothetical protein ENI97_10005 [Gammaproteobacteria bacterium]|nr:hypothetical protein [Gammaproteobacteria bacterium]
MKILFIVVWLMPLSAFAGPLAHTKWLDESVSSCPTSVFFGVKKYIFLNKCYARRLDNVIEQGVYSVSGKSLMLANRHVMSLRQYEFIPRNITSVDILSLSKDRLVLSIDGKPKSLRRAIPGSPAKTKPHSIKKAIRYIPSVSDAKQRPAPL